MSYQKLHENVKVSAWKEIELQYFCIQGGLRVFYKQLSLLI